MPGKSRRDRGKHSGRSKRRRSARVSSAAAAQQPPVSQTYESKPQPEVPAPLASVPAPVAKVTAVRYPYIAAELRRIGILAGIMLIVLVVLALVLS